jgi:DNA-binding beta-propeller fold protein YncE
MMKKSVQIIVFVSVMLFGPVFLLGKKNPVLYGFEQHTIISVSDADMVPSAYTDGKLGEKEGNDVLSVIDFTIDNNYSVVEVPASNSVAGPPVVLTVDPTGKYAYVIETFSPRPNNDNEHTFSDLSPGNKLIVYSIQNPKQPKFLMKIDIQNRPESVSMNFTGEWLAITFYPNKNENIKPIGLYSLEKGMVTKSYYVKIEEDHSNRLISATWHPTKNILAIINQTKAEVSFYKFKERTPSLKRWGNKVSVGKSPFIGKFTQDGKHLLVNNLFWGGDVQGKWNEAPNGTIVNITLDADNANTVSKNKKIRHALSSQVMVGPSPEGFTLSEKGDFVVSANMERSWLPFDDKRQSWFSSLSLIQRNPKTGAMNLLHTVPYDGILPEALLFDSTGDYLAVATFDHYNPAVKKGTIDFFRKVKDPLNPHKPMLMKLRNSIPVTRGVHSMVLIDKKK